MSVDAPERPVLLVLTSTYPRGRRDTVPSFVHDLCLRLVSSFRVIVLAPHASGTTETELLDGVEIIRFRYAPERLERLAYGGGMLANLRQSPAAWALVPFFLVAQYLHASRLIRKHQVRLIHAHWLLPQGIVAAMLVYRFGHRIRVVMTAHGSDLLRLNAGLFGSLRCWAMRRAAVVTVVSDGLRQLAGPGGPDGSLLRVMPMGTDLRDTFFPATPADRDSSTLLYVGRLTAEKGVHHLVNALHEVRMRFPRVRLVLAGTGPEERALHALAARHGLADAINFLGFVSHDHLAEHYRKAAMLILPSLSEGFGLALVEALGCECPVIASDLPGTREIIQTGVTGQLVPPGDEIALSAAIINVLEHSDRARTMAQLGRVRCLERFDWSSAAANYRSLFTGLLDHDA